MIYFISGHLDLSMEEFRTHYVPRLVVAIAENAAFVVDDACGCDLLAQRYLRDIGVTRVQVFHMHIGPRNNAGNFGRVGGFPSDRARDAAMTAVSDADIAWVRPGRESSGTAVNLARRSLKKS